MQNDDSHLSDQALLMDLEGELAPRDHAAVCAHLDGCWECRGRRRALEDAIAEYMRAHRDEFDEKLPPAEGPRALLKAHLARLSAEPPAAGWSAFPRRNEWLLASAICMTIAASLIVPHVLPLRFSKPSRAAGEFSVPDSRLTPGAAVLESRESVCSQANEKNRTVSATVRRQVFEEYGIAQAPPQAYEVDYLVTPALGGADDLRNLWPHSYTAIWNAHVKDALEDRLREMVCGGDLDLAVAQREIAGNWIAAYKKYFHTDQPLIER